MALEHERFVKTWWPISIPILIVGFVIYWTVASFNPDSQFCSHRIYKQPDGTYEVWWIGRSKRREFKCKTYQEAKDYQIKECEDLKRFIMQKPSGERVK